MNASLLRWHPDKFVAAHGGKLKAEERAAVLDKVSMLLRAVQEERERHGAGEADGGATPAHAGRPASRPSSRPASRGGVGGVGVGGGYRGPGRGDAYGRPLTPSRGPQYGAAQYGVPPGYAATRGYSAAAGAARARAAAREPRTIKRPSKVAKAERYQKEDSRYA